MASSGISRVRKKRLAALYLSTILGGAFPTAALAQNIVSPPPVRSTVDSNGVDLLHGNVTDTAKDVSIGPASHHGLSYTRQFTGRGWVQTAVPNITGNSSHPIISFGGASISFSIVGTSYVSDIGDGSTLSLDRKTFTSSEGIVIKFVQDGYTYIDGTINLGSPSSVIFPDGTEWKYIYKTGSYTTSEPDENCDKPCPPIVTQYYHKRLSAIDNGNYRLKLFHQSNTLSTEDSVTAWIRITRIVAFDINAETCAPDATSCSFSGSWPSADYTYPAYGNLPQTVANSLGAVWTYTYDASSRLTSVTPPQATSAAVNIAYATNVFTSPVSMVQKHGSTWSYAFASGSTTVTDPNGKTRTIQYDPTSFLTSSDKNENGEVTSFAYCQSGDANCAISRLKNLTLPGGNAFSYQYNGRGNVTRVIARPSSGSTTIETSATYPSTCASLAACNKPTSVTDARGAVTDYEWNATTGQLTRLTLPVPVSGSARPEKRFSYATISGVSMPIGVSECVTGSSCAGGANERKTTTGYNNNRLPTSVTLSAGDGSVVAPATIGYDAIGNPTSIDGPLAGAADTTTYRYDAVRRLVGEIAADPDGAGALKRRAQRITYDSAGRLTSAEVGTVTGADDSAWGAFASLQQTTSSYDAYGRKTKDVLSAGGTTHQVTQYSYDSLGRLECTAQRMNPALYGGLPASACTMGSVGTFGPDRITKAVYDDASQPTKVQSAIGTADASDEVVKTYTTNGKVATLTDGEGNRTTYEYDEYDRLTKTRFPVATRGANASSATDYEQLTLDPNGNVTSRRLRDGNTLGYAYDALNRLTQLTTAHLTTADQDITFTYDNLDRLTRAAKNALNQTAMTYDALGRKTSESNYYYGLTSQYDAAGRRTRLTWNDGFYVTYDYDVTGNMTAIRENGAASGAGVLAIYLYDDLGRRASVTRGNGTTTNYTFDPVSRLSALTHDLTTPAHDLTLGFSYNPASQITSATRSNDLYAWAGHYNIDRTYTANGLNQYTASGAIVPTYDARGNMTSAGPQAYVYSSLNSLANVPGVTELFTDSLERLDFISVENMLLAYDGPNLASEIIYGGGPGPIQRRYVYGPETDEALVWYEGSGTADRRWLHADERGSIVAVTDSSGAAMAINRYDEYGIPAATNIGRIQYTGQKWIPSIGMYDYKARTYSPTLGRFMQTDPIGYGDGMNWYNYVGGDPVNATDPTGLLCVGDDICIKGGGGSGGFGGFGGLGRVPGLIIHPISGVRDDEEEDVPGLDHEEDEEEEENAEERRKRLAKEDAARRARNRYCAGLRTSAALRGLGLGAAGTAATGAAEAYQRYGTARAAFRGGLRALGSGPGLAVSYLLISYDVLTATNGDPLCQ